MMIRIGYVALCISLLGVPGAQAEVIKDAMRVTAGVSIGAGIGYGLQILNDPTLVSAGLINSYTIPACAVLGAAGGAFFTSYGKSLRLQLGLRHLDRQLLAYVMELASDKSPLEVIDEIQDYYVDTALPLVVAMQNLVRQDDYLGAAVELLECIIESMADNSDRKTYMEKWLSELSTMRTFVSYAIKLIAQDPRFAQMLKIKALQDIGVRNISSYVSA